MQRFEPKPDFKDWPARWASLALRGVFVLVTLIHSGCGMKAEDGAGSSGGGSQSTPFKLRVTVKTKWEGGGADTTWGSCNATSTTPNVGKSTCTINIPEAQLFFSKLKFTFDVESETTCAQVSFYPFYYLSSKSAGYTPPGATAAIDCSGTNWQTNAGCWNGAVKDVVPTFPSQSGRYFLPGASGTSYSGFPDVLSSNEKFTSLVSNNRYTVNSIPNAARAAYPATGVGPFLATAGDCGASAARNPEGVCYLDYYVTCTDVYGETLYSVLMQINDINSTIDQFPTW